MGTDLLARPDCAVLGLYVTEGYLLIDNYPPYEDNDSSRCFAKSLV